MSRPTSQPLPPGVRELLAAIVETLDSDDLRTSAAVVSGAVKAVLSDVWPVDPEHAVEAMREMATGD